MNAAPMYPDSAHNWNQYRLRYIQ